VQAQADIGERGPQSFERHGRGRSGVGHGLSMPAAGAVGEWNDPTQSQQ
jgi:hypothetical protein